MVFLLKRKGAPSFFLIYLWPTRLLLRAKRIFDVLTFPSFLGAQRKSLQHVQNTAVGFKKGLKMNRGDKIGQGWARMRKNGQEWTRMDKNGQEWT